jgi:hypothetical protein
MDGKRIILPMLSAVAVLSFTGPLGAGEQYVPGTISASVAKPPQPADVRALSAYPQTLALRGAEDVRQLIITAHLAGEQLRDLSGGVRYEVVDPKVVRVQPSGRVTPLADGATVVIAHFGSLSTTVRIRTESVATALPINFANQVVPIFTKLGCNAGGCHGKASGQNGFKLSLLGFEPEIDFNALVKEARGRRLTPEAPERSLLLRKATGQAAHGGGKRMEAGSDEYRLVRRWIAAGMPKGQAQDPVVTRVSVYPEHRVLSRQGRQQFSVYAHYSDGSVEDVTRRAQYESNDTEVAVVDGAGLVRTLGLSGEAAIMARYQGHVTAFRATVPLGTTAPAYTFTHQTVVDEATHRKWQQLGLVPSELCSDEQFLRRASLDITGTLPTPTRVRAFVADRDPDKRSKLIDALLESPEYADFFATRWADILRVKRRAQPDRAFGTFAFHQWIREAVAADLPYDAFSRALLTASGDEFGCPPSVWYKEIQTPEQFVDDLAQVFLGQRLACAQCHHHPYERWSQDDYWGLAAFFGRVGRKSILMPGGIAGQQYQRATIYTSALGEVQNKRTGKPAPIKPLDGSPLAVAAGEDPREKLVAWLVDARNPYFARAVANRYWAHFFGRGIVDPPDDMRVTNPPSNPELLDALAKEVVTHGYSLKHLVRTICKSRTYQLSAVPNATNRHDKQTYARYYPRRLSAEVLYDAVSQVTDSPTQFSGLPQDRHGPRRAIMLPDESFSTYFLEVFGKPQRASACECERVADANLAQALHLLNSDEVQAKLTRAGGRADSLSKDKRPEADKVEELFLWAVAHGPTRAQLEAALAHVSKSPQNKKAAYENILWALLNTKEFAFNE